MEQQAYTIFQNHCMWAEGADHLPKRCAYRDDKCDNSGCLGWAAIKKLIEERYGNRKLCTCREA